MLCDLQVHTTLGSPDSHIAPEELVGSASMAGIHGVAVTEHSSFDHAALRAATKHLLVVPAREVTCGGAHILVLSTDEGLLSDLGGAVDPGDERLRRQDTACIWAHPAAPGGSAAYPPVAPGSEVLRDVICAVELLNGRHLHDHRAIEVAAQLAEALGLPVTGGSDAHRVEDVGRCATRFPDSVGDPAGIVEALRKGECSPVLNERWAELRGYDYRESLGRYLG